MMGNLQQHLNEKLVQLRLEAQHTCAKIKVLEEALTALISIEGNASTLLWPQEAILTLLANEPGLEKKQIIDSLVGYTRSKAKNQWHVFSNTIIQLKKKGKIRQDGNQFYLVDE